MLIGLLALGLKWAGVIGSQSVLVPYIGVNASLSIAAAAVVGYLGFNELVRSWILRTGRSGRALLNVVLIADFALIFTVLLASTPPSEYTRGLIFKIFVVQFTRLYFGLRATVVSVVAAAIGYSALIVLATRSGAIVAPEEQFWNLAIFLLGALLLGGLHGQVSGRLERILMLFDRAQEGDFSGSYDETLDKMPDPITMIGRAYNRMRTRLEAMVLTDTGGALGLFQPSRV
ncbi:MAG: hypothetical protein O2973_01665 [Gemmatimonadetes bacterium]|nr:hypothetical protein [Gemmatimonadota bacterium]